MVHLLTCRALGAEAEVEEVEEEAAKAEAEAEAEACLAQSPDDAADEGVVEESTCRLEEKMFQDVAAEDHRADRANDEAHDEAPEEDRVVAVGAAQPHLAAPRREEGGVVEAAVHRSDLAEDDECQDATLVGDL
ncbi:hypothetical protein GCK32_001424 [Trichostrongylus colubriformis]|uniref:Uncharacterized protein n=1 Tax=Trichostrongylus colubriformis TaxID=6319 RepID=A0AAN8F8H4_TRICO